MKISTTVNCKCFRVGLILVFFLVFMSGANLYAQQASKVGKLKHLGKPAEKAKYKLELKNAENEIEATVAVLFLGYKTFLSSQDMNSCVFSPSCSAYAMESFKKHNPVKAYLMTFDRLTRCHPLTKKGQYPITKNQLLYDPVL